MRVCVRTAQARRDFLQVLTLEQAPGKPSCAHVHGRDMKCLVGSSGQRGACRVVFPTNSKEVIPGSGGASWRRPDVRLFSPILAGLASAPCPEAPPPAPLSVAEVALPDEVSGAHLCVPREACSLAPLPDFSGSQQWFCICVRRSPSTVRIETGPSLSSEFVWSACLALMDQLQRLCGPAQEPCVRGGVCRHLWIACRLSLPEEAAARQWATLCTDCCLFLPVPRD